MGLYINPTEVTKEQWLQQYHCGAQRTPPEWNEIPKDQIVICLINNGAFTAAAICYNERELNDFADENDTREKLWVFVKEDYVHLIQPRLSEYID